VRRRLFSLLSLLSLILYVATITAWYFSFRRLDSVTYQHNPAGEFRYQAVMFLFEYGVLRVGYADERFMPYTPPTSGPVVWTPSTPAELRSSMEQFAGWHRNYMLLPSDMSPARHRLGFVFEHTSWLEAHPESPRMFSPPINGCYTSIETWAAAIPLRAVAPFFAVLPLIYTVRWRSRLRRQRRVLAGACLRCGYSLTGNTSGTCPECGTPVPQPSRPA